MATKGHQSGDGSSADSQAKQRATGATGTNGFRQPDLAAMGRVWSDIAERSQRLVGEFLERQATQANQGTPNLDPLNIGGAFLEMTSKMIADPAKLAQAQIGLWQDYVTLWQRTAVRMMGGEAEAVVNPERGDRRFKDSAWDENTLFDFIKQSYLLSARYVQSAVREVDGLDAKTAQKVDFYTRQFIDAMAPSNFVMTNPEVLRTTLGKRRREPRQWP